MYKSVGINDESDENVEALLDALAEAQAVPHGATRAAMISGLHKRLAVALALQPRLAPGLTRLAPGRELGLDGKNGTNGKETNGCTGCKPGCKRVPQAA